MFSPSTEHFVHGDDVVSSVPCKVVVFYDDAHSQERVVKLSDHLVPQFWEDFEFEISWWKVNFITNPIFNGSIAKELVEADIIVFALSPDYEMTLEFKGSLESLMGHRINNSGLLAMVLSDNNSPPQARYFKIHKYLSTLAMTNQMDYLSEWETLRDTGKAGFASKTMNPTDASLAIEGQHWGINE
jgi:hypothetical protein